MPLIRKVVRIGNSKAVFLPKSWFTYYEKANGQEIKEVAIKINGQLTIQPILTDSKMSQLNSGSQDKDSDRLAGHTICKESVFLNSVSKNQKDLGTKEAKFK